MVIIKLVFEKNAIFHQKSAKIAKNCDHNIDPRLGEISPTGRLLTLISFLKTAEIVQKCSVLGDSFTNSFGHPDRDRLGNVGSLVRIQLG
jgi:hypothetical protein